MGRKVYLIFLDLFTASLHKRHYTVFILDITNYYLFFCYHLQCLIEHVENHLQHEAAAENLTFL
jgi:hypothetical protein